MKKEKKKLKENVSSLLALCIVLGMIQVVFVLPIDLIFRIVAGVLLVIMSNTIFNFIEKITGRFGQKRINAVAFLGIALVILLTITFIITSI